MASPNVHQEIQVAFESRRPILPMIFSPTELPDPVTYALAGRQWVEVGDRPDEEWLPSALRALSSLGLQVAEPSAPDETSRPNPRPAARPTAPTAAHNLPAPVTSFVGRESAVAEVSRLIGEHSAVNRLVTLTGAGGSGKTRLAIEVGRLLVERAANSFPDGVWLVELAPISDAEAIPSTFLAAVGGREAPGRPPEETLIEFLRPRAALVIVDSCEHLVSACARVVESLLRACPRLVILATSREPLGIVGEVLWRVPPLSLPAAVQELAPEQALASEAVRLFVDRAAVVRPGFALTARTVAPVVQICSRLDGIPLAIELAAARVKVLTVDQIAERLQDRFRLLTGGSRTALPRQRTLQAMIDWSYDLLSEAERSLLQSLAIFAGSFTLEAAEAVGGEGDMLDLLSQLVEKSLVEADDRGTEVRYRLLETVRQYAVERLEADGRTEAVREQFAQYYGRFGEQAEEGLTRGEQLAWLDRLDPEVGNLRVALEWCRLHDPGAGLRLLRKTDEFWPFRGYFHEARRRLYDLLTLVPTDSPGRAQGMFQACKYAYFAFDLAEAEKVGVEALNLSRALGITDVVAGTLSYLSSGAQFRGDHATAVARGDESVALFRMLGESIGLGYALLFRSMVALVEGDLSTATSELAESVRIFRRFREYRGLGWSLGQLGRAARSAGDLSRAIALMEESRESLDRLRDTVSIVWRLGEMADLVRVAGDTPRAKALVGEALRLGRGLGVELSLYLVLHAAAMLALQGGQFERGVRLLAATYHEADPRGTMAMNEVAEYDRLVEAATGALGPERIEQIRAEGAKMSFQEAAAFAADGLDQERCGGSGSPAAV
jgi:non-specific serine/threonine protein kinase